MKRDLNAEVSAHIVAELEAGAAPWFKPWSATPGSEPSPLNAITSGRNRERHHRQDDFAICVIRPSKNVSSAGFRFG
jgi:N-terminal domain of anti-restriction factor ArdC